MIELDDLIAGDLERMHELGCALTAKEMLLLGICALKPFWIMTLMCLPCAGTPPLQAQATSCHARSMRCSACVRCHSSAGTAAGSLKAWLKASAAQLMMGLRPPGRPSSARRSVLTSDFPLR